MDIARQEIDTADKAAKKPKAERNEQAREEMKFRGFIDYKDGRLYEWRSNALGHTAIFPVRGYRDHLLCG